MSAKNIKFITTKHVCEELHKSKRTVQNWIKLGKLKAEKFGRDYLITESDYQEFKSRHFKIGA